MPDEVTWLFPIVVGESWPEGDEDALRRMAEAWRKAAEGIEGVKAAANNGAQQATSAMEGKTHDAFAKFWDGIGGDGDEAALKQLAEACEKLAKSCDDTALEIEHTKLTIIASLIALLAEIVAMLAAEPFTLGGSSAGIVAAQAGTRAVVTAVFRQLVLSIAKSVARELIVSVAIEFGVQGVQIAEGHRSGFDGGKFTEAAISGAIGGVVGGTFEGVGKSVGRGAGHAVGEAAGDAASHAAESGAKDTAKALGKAALKEGAQGAAEGAISTAGQQLVMEGKINWADVGKGALSGGVTGAGMGAGGEAKHGGGGHGVDVPDVPGSSHSGEFGGGAHGGGSDGGSRSGGSEGGDSRSGGGGSGGGETHSGGSDGARSHSAGSDSGSGASGGGSGSGATSHSSGSSGDPGVSGTSSHTGGSTSHSSGADSGPGSSHGSDSGSSATPQHSSAAAHSSTSDGAGGHSSGDPGSSGGSASGAHRAAPETSHVDSAGAASHDGGGSSGATPHSSGDAGPSRSGSDSAPSGASHPSSGTANHAASGGSADHAPPAGSASHGASTGHVPGAGAHEPSGGGVTSGASHPDRAPEGPASTSAASNAAPAATAAPPAAPGSSHAAHPARTDQAPTGGGMGGMHGGAGEGGARPASSGSSRPGSGGGWTGTPGSPGAAAREAGPRDRPERGPSRPDSGNGTNRPTDAAARGRTGAPARPGTADVPQQRRSPAEPGSGDPARRASAPSGRHPDGPRPGADRGQPPRPTDHGTRPERAGHEGPPRDSQRPHADGTGAHDRQPDSPHPNDPHHAGDPHHGDAEPGTPERHHQIEEAEATRQHTPGGSAYHADPNLRDLASRVPSDGAHHTVDVHATPDGRVRIGDRTFTPEEFADMLRRDPAWDGSRPIRLLACDAGTSGLARSLARELGVPVTAPRGLAWTDGHGRVFSSSASPDGRPGWPPNGGWDTHHPEGHHTSASDDGFHPPHHGEAPGERPEDAAPRGDGPPLSEEEIDKRRKALPEKYYLYDGGKQARLLKGESGPPLRWDENANDGNGAWVEREGTLEPTPETPEHLRDDNAFMEYVYEGKRPAFSASTKYDVYRNTEMNPDGSYKCAVSGKPIPVVTGADGRTPQFYELVDGRRVETTPPEWYPRGTPPSPPHDKFTLPQPGVAHMGHDLDYEYWRQRHFGLNHPMTREQFEQLYDHPGHYRLELKEENEMHGHESTEPGYGRYPDLFRKRFQGQTLAPITLAPADPGQIVKGAPKLGDPRR